MTVESRRDRDCAQPRPPMKDWVNVEDPIRRAMQITEQHADIVFLGAVQWWAGNDQFWHYTRVLAIHGWSTQ
jgi:hypothetical protein